MTIQTNKGAYVVTDRGGIIENRYAVHAAIVDATGRLLYAVGDPTRMTLARSAAKPAQALAILETGGFDHFGFDDADLALVCASHNSEQRHVERARDMLAKVGVCESDLRCGGHAALSETVNRAWIKQGFAPTAVCNNCSGKHAGMLAGTKKIGAKVGEYHLATHPMQVRVKRVYEELCGLEENTLPWGIDGCNLPAPASPLYYLARIYATFAEAARADGTRNRSIRSQSMSRIFWAMATYPELVGGEGRFCTDLMHAFEGQLIGKLGADGCYGIGIRESEQTRRLGAEGALGIAVKIEDGNINILYSAVTEILEQLEIGSLIARKQLGRFYRPDVLNTVGVVTGHVSHLFKVQPASLSDELNVA